MSKASSSVLLVNGGVIVLLLASGLWLVPAVIRTGTDLATKQAEISAYQVQVDALNHAKQQLAAAGQPGGIPLDEKTLNETIPPHRDYEDLLAMIESIGAASGIVDPISISYTPVKEGAAAAIAETPVTLAVKGSYGAIEQLLRNLQTSLRPLALRSVDLAPDASGAMQASIAAVTYTREVTAAATATDGTAAPDATATPTDLMSNGQTP